MKFVPGQRVRVISVGDFGWENCDNVRKNGLKVGDIITVKYVDDRYQNSIVMESDKKTSNYIMNGVHFEALDTVNLNKKRFLTVSQNN